jgi:hypothetical protein
MRLSEIALMSRRVPLYTLGLPCVTAEMVLYVAHPLDNNMTAPKTISTARIFGQLMVSFSGQSVEKKTKAPFL